MPELESQMRQLDEAASTDPWNRVFVWRKVLTYMFEVGFEAGRTAQMRDQSVADRLAKKEAEEKPNA